MTIRPSDLLRGGGAGVGGAGTGGAGGAGGPTGGLGAGAAVDHRLARRFVIAEYRRGRLAQHQVCDAHPELVRAARAIGTETNTECPICSADRLVHVTYVFGPRLPAHGRAISRRGELAALNKRPALLTAYVVEVCRSCSWHHLVKTLPIGRGAAGAPGQAAR